MNKSIWIVMPNAFQFGWMGSTQRLLQIAKAFKTLGFEVTLIAAAYSKREIQSVIDVEFPGAVLRTRHYGSYPVMIDRYPALRRLWRGVWRMLGRSKYWLNVSEGWATRMTPSVVEGLLAASGNKIPSLVWGISAGLLEGGGAAQRIARHFQCPWIYELHDPPLHAGLEDLIDAIDRRFRTLLDDAALIVTNSGTYEQSLQEVYGVPQDKLKTIFLTYVGALAEGIPTQNEKLIIGHFGSMNGKRSALPLLKNLVALVKEDRSLSDLFEICFAGEGQGIEEAISFMEGNGLGHVIKYVGLVPKEQVTELMEQCDALLIIQPDESHLEIPGKLFETMRQLKPIVGLMGRESETAGLLRDSGLGIICEPGDETAFRWVLLDLITQWKNGGVLHHANIEFIGKFSADYLPVHISNAVSVVVDN